MAIALYAIAAKNDKAEINVIADAILQQVLPLAADYRDIATLDLTTDYVIAACLARVDGAGIAAVANQLDAIGMFAVTHGTASGDTGQNRVTPGSFPECELMIAHHQSVNYVLH